jgi:hypothetical protein
VEGVYIVLFLLFDTELTLMSSLISATYYDLCSEILGFLESYKLALKKGLHFGSEVQKSCNCFKRRFCCCVEGESGFHRLSRLIHCHGPLLVSHVALFHRVSLLY